MTLEFTTTLIQTDANVRSTATFQNKIFEKRGPWCSSFQNLCYDCISSFLLFLRDWLQQIRVSHFEWNEIFKKLSMHHFDTSLFIGQSMGVVGWRSARQRHHRFSNRKIWHSSTTKGPNGIENSIIPVAISFYWRETDTHEKKTRAQYLG